MPFVPVLDTGSLLLKGTLPFGHTWTAEWFCDITVATPISQATADLLMNTISAALVAADVDDFRHTSWTFDSLILTDLNSETAGQFTSTDAPISGNNGAQPLPPATCVVTTWETGLRGRSFRGRTYWGGATENFSDGHVGSDEVDAFDAFAVAIIADMAGLNAPLQVVSKFSGFDLVALPNGETVKRPRARADGIATPITSGHTSDIFKVQRRRES